MKKNAFNIRGNLAGVLSVLIILGLWFAVSWLTGFFRAVDFPSPITTFQSLIEKLSGEKIYDYTIFQHTLASLLRWVFAYIVAVLMGILFGLFLGLNSTLNRLFMPLVHVLQLIPGLAWIPIALLMFGLGNVSTLFMIFILALTPIIITTSTGIRETPSDLINAAILMGADRKLLFFHVLFPSALIHIIDGMRIGLANSWRVLIAAEMVVGTGIGLGYIIIQSRWSLDYTSSFVSILVILLIGLTTEKFIFRKIENKLRLKYGLSMLQTRMDSE